MSKDENVNIEAMIEMRARERTETMISANGDGTVLANMKKYLSGLELSDKDVRTILRGIYEIVFPILLSYEEMKIKKSLIQEAIKSLADKSSEAHDRFK
jgi:hypothetical protein